MPRNKWGHQIHKYTKVIFKSPKKKTETVLWRCTLPNCQHYLVGEMVLGKLCLCNKCEDETFEMKRVHLGKKKPHCFRCSKTFSDNFKGKEERASTPSAVNILDNLDKLLKMED
jgi:hypothetical protein